MIEPITFLASFPAIQSAIRRGHDGMRIQLDIPESDVMNAVPLLALQGVVLRVTIEVSPEKAKPLLDELLCDLARNEEEWNYGG